MRLLAAAVAVSVAALAAACSPAGPQTAPASSEGSAKPKLTFALTSAPTSLDPSKGSGGQNTVFQDPAYQGLLHATGNAEAVPSLAEAFAWKDTTNTELEVKLRPGLKFSDGTALDAAAVKTSIEHFKTNGSVFAYVAAPIKTIETPNDTTVVFHLSEPTPDLVINLAEQSGLGMIISPKAITDGTNLGTSTVGAGPYVLSQGDTVQGSVYTYTPNTHYYDQDAIKYSKIVLKVIANANTALSALQSGQLDVTYGEFDTLKAAQSAGVSIVAYPVDVNGLWIQDQHGQLVPALGNLKVRQAMQHAVDRASISEAVTLGAGQPIRQSVTPGSLGYDESLESSYPYDVEKAKSLLAEAGYGDGFSMQITVAPGPDNQTLAQALVSQLGQVGIKVTIVPSSTFPEYAKQQESGQYAGTVVGLGMQGGMLDAMSNLFNPSGLVNARHTKFDDVVSAATKSAATQGDEQTAAWQAVNRMTVEQALMLPVTTGPSLYFWNKTVTGVDGSHMVNPVFFSPAG